MYRAIWFRDVGQKQFIIIYKILQHLKRDELRKHARELGVYRFGLHGNLRNTVVFWFETIGLVSFGISWLTKGEIWLKDEEKEEERLTTG